MIHGALPLATHPEPRSALALWDRHRGDLPVDDIMRPRRTPFRRFRSAALKVATRLRRGGFVLFGLCRGGGRPGSDLPRALPPRPLGMARCATTPAPVPS